MTCADLEILLCDYADGTLTGDQKAAVEEHLAACAACAQLAEDISAVVAFTGKVPPVEPPDELVTRLLFQAPRAGTGAKRAGIRGLLTGWLAPVLQPRFAMGMAMTVLSFSLLARFAGIEERQLSPADLHPVKVWNAVDDRFNRALDQVVKYYDSLRVVYEIQSRLSEWSEEEPPAAPEPPAANSPQSELSPIAPDGQSAGESTEGSEAR